MSGRPNGHRLVTRRLLSSMFALPEECLLVDPDATAGDLLDVMAEGTSDSRDRWVLLVPADGMVRPEHEAAGLPIEATRMRVADTTRIRVSDAPDPLAASSPEPDQVPLWDVLTVGGALLITDLSGTPGAVVRCLADIPDEIATGDKVTVALRGNTVGGVWQSCGIAVEWFTTRAQSEAQPASAASLR